MFVLRNPRKLLVPIKIAGGKALFELPENVVSTAIHTAKKMPSTWFPYYGDNLPSVQQRKDSNAEAEAVVERELPTLEFVEKSEKVVHLKIVNPELKLNEFVRAFEKLAGKRIERGKAGLRNQKVDLSLPGYEPLRELLVEIHKEAFNVSKEEARSILPKNLDVYGLSKTTKKFAFEREYFMVICVGKKAEFYMGEAEVPVRMGDGHLVTSSKYESTIGLFGFAKIVKNVDHFDSVVQSGETLVLAFH